MVTKNPPQATSLQPQRFQFFKPRTWTEWSAPKRYNEWICAHGTFIWWYTFSCLWVLIVKCLPWVISKNDLEVGLKIDYCDKNVFLYLFIQTGWSERLLAQSLCLSACLHRVLSSLTPSTYKWMTIAKLSNFRRLLVTEQSTPSAPGNMMFQRCPCWVWRTRCQRCQS